MIARREFDNGARSIECDECGHAVVMRDDEEPKTFRFWLSRHGWTNRAGRDVCSDCNEKAQHIADRERRSA